MLIPLVSCSDQNGKDDPDSPDFEEGIPTEVTITLSARSGNAQTRADEKKEPDGTPKDPTSTIELIHNWWIVFIDKNGNIVKTIKDTDADVYDKVTSTSVNISGGYEAETFRTIIPSGTYRIYAFANIPFDEKIYKSIFGDSNKFKGGQLKNVHINDFVPTAFLGNVNSENDGMQWRDTENIPMTQILKDLVIKNTVEEAFNIEVVRTVAKVQFSFSNPSADAITIKELRFSPISKGDKISIVPNNDSVGCAPNTKLITDKVETGILTFDLDSKKLTTNQYHSFSFYCNESLPHDAEKYNKNPDQYNESKIFTDLYTQHFTIDLKIYRNGEEEEKTLYTSKITYINRNDWIYIPIKFNDWIVIWRLHTYPPIGGYPAVYSQSGTGNNLTATVTTGGEFELYPVQIKKNNQNTNFSESVDWNHEGMKVEVLAGSNDLFVEGKSPKVVNNPGNSGTHPITSTKFPKIVMGEFDPNKVGTAKVKITFYLKDTEYTDTKFECTFTILRQNGYPTPPSN